MDTKGIGKNSLIAPNTKDLSKKSSIDGSGADAAKLSNSAKALRDTSVSVELSNRAQKILDDRQKALNIARNTPDIREDRVAMLKSQIQNGGYKVDSGKIADSMLLEAIRDELASNVEV